MEFRRQHRVAELTAGIDLPPDVRLRLLIERTTCLLMMGDNQGWSAAAAIPADAATAAERLVITLGHQNSGDQSVMWGRYADAARSLATAQQLAQTRNYVRYDGNIAITQAHLDWYTGAWEGLADRVQALAEGILSLPAVLMDADTGDPHPHRGLPPRGRPGRIRPPCLGTGRHPAGKHAAPRGRAAPR